MSILDIARRREIPAIITSILLILVIFTSWFGGTVVKPIANAVTEIKTWNLLISAFSVGLAAIKLIQYETGNFRKAAVGREAL